MAGKNWLVFSKESAPEGMPANVVAAIRSWLGRHQVAELALEPLDGFFAIHINSDPRPVPGVFLPVGLQEDEEEVTAVLEAAYTIWDKELAAY